MRDERAAPYSLASADGVEALKAKRAHPGTNRPRASTIDGRPQLTGCR